MMVSSARALIVDDLAANRALLARRLSRLRLEVAEAASGQEALDLLRAQPFDIVLLDVMMPELDGCQTLGFIKSDPRLREIPVLMVSALDELSSVVRCIELGADDYLPKPFEGAILDARVAACLEKKRLRDSERALVEDLRQERNRSEELLLNVLPKEIAGRLKNGESSIADNFSEVTILFADLVGFTELASRLAPRETVRLLDSIFSGFDALAGRHRLEKIKTMGDAYLVAGGIPVPRPDHAEAVAEMALGMRDVVQACGASSGETLCIRIGIASGPVVAGVIGKKKFIYDLWGDAVNTASRMESHGVAGRIQVSASTHRLLGDRYRCAERGPIAVKGKGPMLTYFLLGREERLESTG